MAPSTLLSQQIFTLTILNGFQNVIKHKMNKKDETMIIKKWKKKKIDILFSKIVKSVMNFPKHTHTEMYGAFQQTWFWFKCRFTGLWLHMPVESLNPIVCSILAFHSVQQNFNSLLKYFPYLSICNCLYLPIYDQVMVYTATKEFDWGLHISSCCHFYVQVVKRGARKIKEINGKREARAFWCQKRKRKLYLWPPPPTLWTHKQNFDPSIWGIFFSWCPLKLPSPPPSPYPSW